MSKRSNQLLTRIATAKNAVGQTVSPRGYLAATAARGVMVVHMALQTVNPLNRREHWAARAKRAKRERETTHFRLLEYRSVLPHLPATVTLTRIAPRVMDSDGLAASFKHVRDGIQDAYGVDDGSELFRWVYRQERGPYGVRIEVAAAAEGEGKP